VEEEKELPPWLENPAQFNEAYNEESLKDAISVLEPFQKGVEKRVERLRDTIAELQSKIKESYVLREEKYLLSSILIHQGEAGSGHYFSYIQDLEDGKWRCFSDIAVREES